MLNSIAVAATAAYVTTHGPSQTTVVHGFATAGVTAAVAVVTTAVIATVLIRTPAPRGTGAAAGSPPDGATAPPGTHDMEPVQP